MNRLLYCVSSLIFRCLALPAALLILGTPSFAQIGGTGSIQGTITDPSGAVVSGATVTATNVATNATATQQSSSSGFYSLAALPPRVYTITVEWRHAFR